MKNEENRKYLKYALTGFAAISMSILFFFLLFRLQGVGNALNNIIAALRPILIGAGLAYVLRPICNQLELTFMRILPRKLRKFANALAVFLSLLLAILLVYVLLIMIIPQVYRSIISLQHTLPRQAANLVARLKVYFSDNAAILSAIDEGYAELQVSLNDLLSAYILPNLSLIMTGVGTGVGIIKDIAIGVIAAIYLLSARKKLLRQAKMIVYATLTPKWAGLLLKETVYADQKFGGFISGKLIDSLIIGILCYVFSLILNFPNALLISVVIGVTNIIPFFGPFIGAIPSALLILIQAPEKTLLFVIFILVLQQLDGNVIGPRILGNTTGLSSFWVLFSILFFGNLFGFIGMVLGVPVFAVIYDIIRSLVHIGLRKHGYSPQ